VSGRHHPGAQSERLERELEQGDLFAPHASPFSMSLFLSMSVMVAASMSKVVSRVP
jgi:hypothetical protein